MTTGIFKVYYFGLICHIGLGTTKKIRAAVVRDAEHVPIIFYGDGTYSLINGVDHVLFRGLQGSKVIELRGTPDTDPLFERFVPSLKTIMGGRLQDDVATNETAARAIIVDYPSLPSDAGTLSVNDLYPEKGVYKVNGNERWNDCVARLTGLSVPLDVTAVQILTKTGGTYTLIATVEPNDCILIGNISLPEQVELFLKELSPAPPPETKEPSGSATQHREPSSHVQKYGQILDNEYNVMVSDGDPCSDHVSPPGCDWVLTTIGKMVQQGILTSIHIECGNTNWP